MGRHHSRLSKRIIDNLDSEGSDFVKWDCEVRGFGIRVWPSGRKIFIFKYRSRSGLQRKFTIGEFGAITVVQARKIARKLSLEVSTGLDPQLERKAARNQVRMRELCDRYMKDHSRVHKKPTSIRSDEILIRLHIKPTLGRMLVMDVTNPDIHRLQMKMANAGKKYASNRAVAVLSKMFNLAELWGVRPQGSNPCRHIRRFREERRERYLSGEELARLGQTLRDFEHEGKASCSVVAAIRLLVLTGCRLGEILALEWNHVDFEGARLLLPDSKTGAKIVPIGAPVLEVLSGLEPGEPGAFVVPGQRAGKPLNNLQKPWRKVREAAGLEDVRLHDLRHTFASFGAGANLSLPIIGKLLGHTQAQTTERYAHLAADPLKAAADRISGTIAAALAGGHHGVEEPVPMAKRQENR